MQSLLDALTPGSEEWQLAHKLDRERVPAHIAVIMDGNGRWAGARNLPRVAGHKAGVDPVRTTVETCAQMGVQSVTLYAFSLENWKRPLVEVQTLWRLLRYYLRREVAALCKNNIRLNAIGRLDLLPEAVQEELRDSIRRTSTNTGLQLNLAIAYGGRQEIVDAVNELITEARQEGRLARLQVDEDAIASRLYTAGLPDPDLLIRTSGEMRVSNFLLWQIAYAELHVTEVLWPDFSRADLIRAVLDYQGRDRRFGGIRTGVVAPLAEDELLEELGATSR